ncbi:hypothetical protein PGTUg99_010997 [Puccinia graminis f. sp. tritici]|uniref:Uncharacterized protein n=1 Tax=Puccinia graminis f. sp. tritici TaxID=56615 RepID=A0A5B0RDQ8_PUCGR|nr:hypothetical protein PGTUg99_010997 [Puccinia graminis f. sp. tritici]
MEDSEDLNKFTLSSAQTIEETNHQVVDNLPSPGSIAVKLNGYNCEGLLCPGLLFNFISEEEAQELDFDVHPQDIWMPGICDDDIKISGIALASLSIGGVFETTSFLVTQKIGPLILGKPFMKDFSAVINYNEPEPPILKVSDPGGIKHLFPISQVERTSSQGIRSDFKDTSSYLATLASIWVQCCNKDGWTVVGLKSIVSFFSQPLYKYFLSEDGYKQLYQELLIKGWLDWRGLFFFFRLAF